MTQLGPTLKLGPTTRLGAVDVAPITVTTGDGIGLHDTTAAGTPRFASDRIKITDTATVRAVGIGTRGLGWPTITTTGKIMRPIGQQHARQQGSPTVSPRRPQSLTHTRALGIPRLTGRVYPPGLAHQRAITAPSVAPRNLAPAGLTRVPA